MTNYEKARIEDIDGTPKQKEAWKIIGRLLVPNEYDGVIKINSHYVAHSISEEGTVEAYDLYSEEGNFIRSYKDFSILYQTIS